jgi:hypothetical protein
VVSATTTLPDTAPPLVPSSLTATPVGCTQVSLSGRRRRIRAARA